MYFGFPVIILDENPSYMKLFHPKRILYFQGKLKLTGVSNPILFLQKEFTKFNEKFLDSHEGPVNTVSAHPFVEAVNSLQVSKNIKSFFHGVRSLGYTQTMDDFEKSKLG